MVLRLAGPFDLPLSLQAAAVFYPRDEALPRALRVAVRTDRGLGVMEVEQLSPNPARVGVRLSHGEGGPQFGELARRLVSADFDLRPFYRLAIPDPVMGPVAASLAGLKLLQPATIFEAAVIAITEQQLSMAAAYRIRSRIVHSFGERAEDLWRFPDPERLADAADAELAQCGLSRQKIGYLKALARSIVAREVDLEAMRRDSDAEIRASLREMPGFGRWSVEHVLLHGFGRPGALPSTDISLQKVVGHYLANDRRLTPDELERALSPFRPHEGLAAFYLSVAYRRQGTKSPRSASRTPLNGQAHAEPARRRHRSSYPGRSPRRG
jgi:DNA-3-methyladenine glycosylase II